MRDHVHVLDAELAQPRGAVLGVHDHGVHPPVEARLRGELAGARLAREHVVSGEHTRTPRQQDAVQVLHRQPLEVHDIRGPGGARVAQHVGYVLGEPRGATTTRRGPAVERLADADAGRVRHVSVAERARPQLHVRPRSGECRGERPVVRRRVGRRIDQVDAHGASDYDSAFCRFTRPKPKLGSRPAAPLSSTDASSLERTCAAVKPGFLPQISAATPATCGVAIDVPENETYPPPRLVERMFTPGAAISTSLLAFENDARASRLSVAATLTTSA